MSHKKKIKEIQDKIKNISRDCHMAGVFDLFRKKPFGDPDGPFVLKR